MKTARQKMKFYLSSSPMTEKDFSLRSHNEYVSSVDYFKLRDEYNTAKYRLDKIVNGRKTKTPLADLIKQVYRIVNESEHGEAIEKFAKLRSELGKLYKSCGEEE